MANECLSPHDMLDKYPVEITDGGKLIIDSATFDEQYNFTCKAVDDKLQEYYKQITANFEEQASQKSEELTMNTFLEEYSDLCDPNKKAIDVYV